MCSEILFFFFVVKFLSANFCIKNTVLLRVRSEEEDSKQMALACFKEKKNLEVEKKSEEG